MLCCGSEHLTERQGKQGRSREEQAEEEKQQEQNTTSERIWERMGDHQRSISRSASCLLGGLHWVHWCQISTEVPMEHFAHSSICFPELNNPEEPGE